MFILIGIEVVSESLIDSTNDHCNGPGEGIQFAYEAGIKEVFLDTAQEQLTGSLTFVQVDICLYIHCFGGIVI